MTEPARQMTPSELNSLTKRLAARATRPAVVDIATRKPLGLRPLPDDDNESRSRSPPPSSRTPRPGQPAAHDDLLMVTDALGAVVAALNDGQDRIATKFADMEARFSNQIAALKTESAGLRLILENLRVTQRGERGVDGDRGPPGRDGRDGEGRVGPAGPVGPKGSDAARIIAWEISDAEFVAWPLLSTGQKGAALHLRGMFETYNAQVDA